MELEKRKLLVVAENRNIQDLINNHNGTYSFQIFSAANHAEMLLYLREDVEFGAVIIGKSMCDSDFNNITDVKKINPYIRIIIIADEWQLDSARKAMNVGIFDYLTYPIDGKHFLNIIDNAIEQSFSRLNSAKTRQKLLSLQRDLEIAGEVQNYILPQSDAEYPGCKIHALMIPTRNIGGDFYDYFTIDNNHIGIVIGDVSGKGIPAALFMAMTRSLIKMSAKTGVSPDNCLNQVNSALSKENPSVMFATVFYGILNLVTNEFIYSNAGHNLPYLIKADGRINCLPGTGDMVLGFDEDIEYHSNRIEINPGELLFLYTDGVTEAANNENKMYGKDRLEQMFSQLNISDPKQLVTKVVSAVTDFSSGAVQSDDITMLALVRERQQDDPETDQNEQFSFILENNIEQLVVLQKKINLFCTKNNLVFATRHAMDITLEELFTNIINYAYTDTDKHDIHIHFSMSDRTVHIEIRDDGQPFDPIINRPGEKKASLEQSKIGGWGLQIVHNYMDNISYERDGNNNVLKLELKMVVSKVL